MRRGELQVGDVVETGLYLYDGERERSVYSPVQGRVQALNGGDVLVIFNRAYEVNNTFFGFNEPEMWTWAWVGEDDCFLFSRSAA